MNFCDFIRQEGKKALITDRVSITNKIIRRYAKEKPVYGVKEMSLSQLAAQILFAYQAMYQPDVQYRILNHSMQTVRLLMCLKRPDCQFLDSKSINLSTAEEILSSVNQIRYNEGKGAFRSCGDEKRLDDGGVVAGGKDTSRSGGDAKIAGLRETIANYEKNLAEKMELDEVMVYRKAIEILEKMEQPDPWVTAMVPDFAGAELGQFFTVKLTLLEEKFLNLFTAALGREAAELEVETNQPGSYEFYKAYGAEQEVRSLISAIGAKNEKYDDVAVIYPAELYENILRGEFNSAGIPFIFPEGYSAAGTEFTDLMLEFLDFVDSDFSYEALYGILENPALRIPDTRGKKAYRGILKEGIGYGRQRYIDFFNDHAELSEEDQPFLDFLKDLIECFQDGDTCGATYRKFMKFVRKYTAPGRSNGKTGENKTVAEQTVAAQTIAEQTVEAQNAEARTVEAQTTQEQTVENSEDVDAEDRKDGDQKEKQKIGKGRLDIIKERSVMADQLKEYAPVLDLYDGTDLKENVALIRSILRQCRCSISEEDGAVSILPYGSLEVIDRKHIYVIGLSGENIEKVPMESPVLSDTELKQYIEGTIKFAGDLNKDKREAFQKTLDFSTAKDIFVSYAYYDTEKMLQIAPSILFHNLMADAGKTEKDVEKLCYALLPETEDPLQPDVQAEDTEQLDESREEAEIRLRFSASTLNKFLYCPLSYVYKNIERIPEIEFFERRPDQWLKANVKGTLFHETMENYVNRAIIEKEETSFDRDIFDSAYEQALEEILRKNPYPSEYVMNTEKQESRKAAEEYAIALHKEIRDSAENKKVIGCEIYFDKLEYKLEAENEEDRIAIEFQGYVDRLDGYVDEDHTLWLQIYDYKTGNYSKMKKQLEKEKKEGQVSQIQHHVYAIAMLDWANEAENRKKLEERFGTGINKVKLKEMKYIYPFETDKKELPSALSTYNGGEDARLPKDVEVQLAKMYYALEKGGAAEVLKDNYESVREKIEKAEISCRYCSYKEICRC